jgi:hypothetical protein
VAVEPTPVYVSQESPLELTVNFGLFAGRKASRAEIDKLGAALLTHVSGATLFAGRRYEFANGSAEVAAHEVRVQFPPFVLPSNPAEQDELVAKLLETISQWTRESATSPPPDGEDLAARILRASTTTEG